MNNDKIELHANILTALYSLKSQDMSPRKFLDEQMVGDNLSYGEARQVKRLFLRRATKEKWQHFSLLRNILLI